MIKTKSAEYMPFSLSFFLTLSAVAWFFYGLFTKDIYVTVRLPYKTSISFIVKYPCSLVQYVLQSTCVHIYMNSCSSRTWAGSSSGSPR